MNKAETAAERVLVLAPTGHDATLICESMRPAGIACEVCESIGDLSYRLSEGVGVVVLAEEALYSESVASLFHELGNQPAWSDIPFLFLTRPGGRLASTSTNAIEMFGDSANITILERPVRVGTLLSVIRSSLRARRRRYEVRDYIADRRKIEDDLRQTQKLESIGVLAGGVAHDFNNLLVGILGNASLALDTIPADSPAYPLLEDVVLAGQRAADLTRQLLAYSGKGKFIIRQLNLSNLVREINGLVQPSIPKKVRIQLELNEDLPLVEGDSSQLQQLVMNLVINAAEAVGPDQTGVVIVKTGVRDFTPDEVVHPIPPTEIRPGHYVSLEVHDNGIGMAPQTISKIFDPFFTTKFTGRGLGLAAALGVVRGHHGGIEVESSPGTGATFRVYLPVATSDVSEPHCAARRQDLLGTGVILFVDDEDVVREVAKSCLQRYGYQVLLAENGLDAVEMFRKMPDGIILVVLDMNMPVMSGDETLRELRNIRPNVKIILSSGYNEAEAVQHFHGRGLAGFIQKPYTAAELAQSVKTALTKSQRAGRAFGTIQA